MKTLGNRAKRVKRTGWIETACALCAMVVILAGCNAEDAERANRAAEVILTRTSGQTPGATAGAGTTTSPTPVAGATGIATSASTASSATGASPNTTANAIVTATPSLFYTRCLARQATTLYREPATSATVVIALGAREIFTAYGRTADAAWVLGWKNEQDFGWTDASVVACLTPIRELMPAEPNALLLTPVAAVAQVDTPAPSPATPSALVPSPAPLTPTTGAVETDTLTATIAGTATALPPTPSPAPTLASTAIPPTASPEPTASLAPTSTPIQPTPSPAPTGTSVPLTVSPTTTTPPVPTTAPPTPTLMSTAAPLPLSSPTAIVEVQIVTVVVTVTVPVATAGTPLPELATPTSTPSAGRTVTPTESPDLPTRAPAQAPTAVAARALNCEVTPGTPVNFRQAPARTARLIGTLRAGTLFTGQGRNDDGSWLYGEGPQRVFGWLIASAVQCSGDVSQLPAVDR